MAQQANSMATWLALFERADIPVMRQTARSLERLRDDQGQVNASSIAGVVTDDPLMTVKLLRYMQNHKRSSQAYELVDVKQMLLMMGVETFFRVLPAQPVVEETLRGHMDALVCLFQTVRRAQRAADYAFDWALRLHDLHAQEVLVSALLSHVTEMLMWCFNPEQMLDIRKRQLADKTLRSADVQTEVMGFTGVELQRRLTLDWHLPELLQNLMDPALAHTPRVRNVTLAVNLARHSASGWDNAALPDDYTAIGALLRMEPARVAALVGGDEAVAAARKRSPPDDAST
ncbi:MAG: HDOD domain-containing protein [Thiobacillus sp.]|nr:HDOD domain-containing protein [Thiobacillus sp.]